MRQAHSGSVQTLGQMLKTERTRRGQSQVEASEEIGVQQPRYQRWESGLNDVAGEREVHDRVRIYLGLTPEAYAQAALEHAIKVVERRK